MRKSVERVTGDSEGVSYEFPVLRFSGSDKSAPSAYLQAALHAGELPGVVAIDALMPMLSKAEAEGRIRGSITVVPWANPIGRAQYHLGEHQGRFHLGTRTNFNRGFPLLAAPDTALLPAHGAADKRLKIRLVQLSLGHDIVLDLHCDDEGLAYLYIHTSLWPFMADCAAAMGVDAVLLDNMTPDLLREAVGIIDNRAIAEASGGITPATAAAIAESGVDLLSVGWITHSAPTLDIGLDYVGSA